MNIIKRLKYFTKSQIELKEIELEDKIHIQLWVDNKRTTGLFLMKKKAYETDINQAKEGLVLRYCTDKGYLI